MSVSRKSILALVVASIALSVASGAMAMPGKPINSPPIYVPGPIYVPLPLPTPGNDHDSDDGSSGPADKPLAYTNLALNCEIVDGQLWLLNVGADDISGGTRIRFSVPSSGDHGAFLLPQGIEGGGKLMLQDQLGAGAEGACRVQVLN